jgi:hypothetical protein
MIYRVDPGVSGAVPQPSSRRSDAGSSQVQLLERNDGEKLFNVVRPIVWPLGAR